VPQSYVPDTLNNFEIGWKSTLLNGHLVWEWRGVSHELEAAADHHLRR